MKKFSKPKEPRKLNKARNSKNSKTLIGTKKSL